MSKKTFVKTLLEEVIDVITFADDVQSTVQGKSFADANRLTQLEPFCMYSRDLSNETYLNDIQQLALSLFVSYYLVAVEAVADVNRAEVVRVLSSVNPDVGLESYHVSLHDAKELPLPNMQAIGEAIIGSTRSGGHGSSSAKVAKDKDSITAIGKQVDVTITPRTEKNNAEKVTISTFVKMVNVPIDTSIMVDQLTLTRRDNSFVERWHKMRAGSIPFRRDFIWAEDIIEEERRIASHPDSEVIMKIKQRHRAGLLKSARGKGDSYGIGSNVMIVSSDVLDEVERRSKHAITMRGTLNELFAALHFMILIVVDKEEEQVTMYFKNIEQGSVHSIKSIIKVSKGTGPDIISMIRDLSRSDLPNF